MNPELKVKDIVFDQTWHVHKTMVDTGNVDSAGMPIREEKIKYKGRIAVVTVENPLDSTKSAVLGYRVYIKMDYEGGGSYGEAHCSIMEHILPVNHGIDLYADDGYKNVAYIVNQWRNVIEEIRPHVIYYKNRQVLYNYHAVDIFIPVKE